MLVIRQRIRDPLHNLIEFRADHFENTMWNVIQSRSFQRLGRVKQLGFSELVYPGATHTRFSHSVGVFHTARLLVRVITEHLGEKRYEPPKAQTALAAALLHDVGHGPFSHTFEEVGKRLGLKMARHEALSDILIRSGDISAALREWHSGFASDVADVVSRDSPKDIYGAIVSSQFDADRLDYMRRDRLMTGTHHGAIDFDWLLSNIEIGQVEYGVDEESVGKVETFVLGPKATYAAESCLLGLFQLYPTIYFHKTTRGAEKIFSEILYRAINLVRDGSIGMIGLPDTHPLVLFAKRPEEIENIVRLDDTVIWGALSMMADAKDETVSAFSKRLRDRNLFKCFDVRDSIVQKLENAAEPDLVDSICVAVREKIESWLEENRVGAPRILVDQAEREPYRQFTESKGPLNQIMLRGRNQDLIDVSKLSKVVAAIETFKLFRVYTAKEDGQASNFIKQAISEEVSKTHA